MENGRAGGKDYAMIFDQFIDSALSGTPALYTVIDESFGLLYVSDNFVALTGRSREELLSGKCFNVTGRKMQCAMADGGSPLCPVARAFATGEKQYSLIEEDTPGGKIYHDNFAVPMELEGQDGEKIRCCLEILFDRTAEKSAQRIFERDLSLLVEKISNMVEEILPEVSGNAHEIIREANIFSEYLDSVRVGAPGALGAADHVERWRG
jgi:hypothetical protein